MLLRTEKKTKEHTPILSASELESSRRRLWLLEPNGLEEEPRRTGDRTSEWDSV